MFSAVFVTSCMNIASKKEKYLNSYAFLLYAFLTAMTCLRYGQGTDYFNYHHIFDIAESLGGVLFSRFEPLYMLLCFVFKKLANYQIFIASISLAEMIMIWRFIRRRSAEKSVSVMILMTVVYLVYICSYLRQGLAMSIFLCFGLELAEKREWKKYFLLCAALSMIHYVSVIYFFVPLALKFNVNSIVMCIPVCVILSAVILPKLGEVIPYFEIGFSYQAAAERALTFIMVYAAYSLLSDNVKYKWLMRLYCFGIALYFLFLPFSYIASRVAVCFKALEIVIVPCLISERSRYRKIFVCYFFALYVVMFVHTLNNEVFFGRYFDDVNVINYPYVSVFNAEDIYNYRQMEIVLGLNLITK